MKDNNLIGNFLSKQNIFLNFLEKFLKNLQKNNNDLNSSLKIVFYFVYVIYESVKFIMILIIVSLIISVIFFILKIFNNTTLLSTFKYIVGLISIGFLYYCSKVFKSFIDLKSNQRAEKIDKILEKKGIKLPL